MKKKNESQGNLRLSQQSPVPSTNQMDKKSQASLQNSQNKVSKDRKSGLSGVSGTRKNGAKVSLLFDK